MKRMGKLAAAALLVLAAGTAMAAETATGAGRILSEPPGKADRGATYLFYLHGRIVQEQGREAVSPKYGRYEYDAILGRLAEAELRLETGLHHGFLYRALPEWIGPVVRWARERAA